jgi:hypothetical protein
MSRKEHPTLDRADEDDMPQEVDFSKAVRANTAYRFGEDRQDELRIEQFWRALGFEAEFIAEPNNPRSMAPDLLLKREGTARGVCEIKSMSEFDYMVSLIHDDGSRTNSQHTWQESASERVLRLANRAMEQLAYWNRDHALANIFVFVNRDGKVLVEEVQSRLLELSGIDATFWFEGEKESIGFGPVVIASAAGQTRLTMELGLTLEMRLKLTSAA